MDNIANVHSIHYEVGSGTAIGAVKLSNFIPWDIDADTYVTKPVFMELFSSKAQMGIVAFEKAGMKGNNSQ